MADQSSKPKTRLVLFIIFTITSLSMSEKKPEKSVWQSMWEGAKDAFADQPEPRQLTEAEKAENARRLAPKTGNIKKYGIDKAFGSGE